MLDNLDKMEYIYIYIWVCGFGSSVDWVLVNPMVTVMCDVMWDMTEARYRHVSVSRLW